MSFSTDVRGELARVKVDDICCARSELASALLASEGIAWRGADRYAVSITASDAATVRRYFSMLKKHWGIAGEIRVVSGDRLNRLTRYRLVIEEADALALLRELQLLEMPGPFGIRQAPPEEITHYSCCKKSFVRAAFLMCGVVGNPEKSYHIEIAASSEAFAQRLKACLEYFEIVCSVTERRGKPVVYIKRAEGISEMLSLLGAGAAVLTLENIRIQKQVSNHVNRQMNFDQSNINRTVDAAGSVIEDIRYIDEELGLDKLPKSLREMAFARANNPEHSLSALGELMEPPLGKSGVNARLRRLTEIADKLRSGEEVRFGRRKD